MLLAALHTTLALSLLVNCTYSVCLLSRPCPCGSSGKSYMRCFETIFQQYSCESWSNCLTCQDYNEFCVTCPPGFSGLTCKNEVKVEPDRSCNHPGWVEKGIIEDIIPGSELFPVGTKLRIRCEEGYQREGPKAIYCLSSLYWSEDLPVCRSVSSAEVSIPGFLPSCDRPESVENGFIENDSPEKQNFSVHTILNFKCKEGYHLVGASYIQCLLPSAGLVRSSPEPKSGFWSDLPPVCRPTFTTKILIPDFVPSCDRPETVENGFIENDKPEKQNFPAHTILNFKCKEGYYLVGARFIKCLLPTVELVGSSTETVSDGVWSDFPPVCRSTLTTKRRKRNLRLQRGIIFSATQKDCTIRITGNISFNCTTDIDGKRACDVACNDKRLGRFHCLPGNGWSSTLPSCEVKKEKNEKIEASCKHPEVFENGIIEDSQSGTENFPAGTHLRFICRKGYERKGPETIYCRSNLQWSDDPPVCMPITTTTVPTASSTPSCPRLEPIENGFIQNDVGKMQSFPIGSYLNFKCHKGYLLKGVAVIHCLLSSDQLGYWSDRPPSCKHFSRPTTSVSMNEVACKNPGSVENGMFDNYPPETVSFQVGTSLKLRCAQGYALEGSESIYCLRSGEWSENLPKCQLIPKAEVPEVSCGHPGMVANGTFENMYQSDFPVGSSLTFQCMPGTRIQGERTIYCLFNGNWSASPPICKMSSKTTPTRREPERDSRTSCKYPGLVDNGVYEPNISPSDVFTAGKQLKFKCNKGYTMIGSDNIHCRNNGEWSSAPPECKRSKNIAECGRVFQESYKSSGKQTRGDWPWTVGLSTGDDNDIEKIFCGGALFNSKTVLTAAHCVTGSQNIKLHFDYRRPVSEHVRKVSNVIIHPDYDDKTHANDIALIKIDRHVYYDPRTQPICLPTETLKLSGKNLLAGTTTYVAGYGLEFTSNHSSTPAFKVFELPVLSEKVCEPLCHDQELVSCSPNTFCAGYLKDTKECLYGGTPLVVYHKEKSQYTLEGIVTRAQSARNSWDGKCKRAESFTTFTNVTHFMPFITENSN